MAIDPKYKPIFTLVGLSKIANAINSGVKIELSKMALGDADGIDYTPTESMTALTHEVVRFNLRTLWYENVTAINKTILKFTGILEPGIISSKTVREVGVYDKDEDLIIIFRIPDRPILTDGNIATILDLTFGITLATDSNVFMTLGDTTGNFVTLTEYNGHVNNLNNPHNVNKTQIGLPLAENTRDIDKVVASAGKLTTVRTINGTNFDGTANIVVPINVTAKSDNINYSLPFINGAAGNQSTYIDNDGNLTYNPSTNTLSSANFTGSLNGNATTVSKLLLSDSTNPVAGPDSTTKNTIGYVNGLSVLGQTDGALYSQVHSALWEHQIFGDYKTGAMATRGKNNGVWQPWKTVAYLDSSITGNAATATKLQTARTITLSGDISSSVSFDGSDNVTLNTTLPNIITAGTYRSVTVNAKGLVTAGTNPTTLNGYGITDAVTASRASATFDAAANAWYRIATSPVDILKNSGVFAIDWSRSGQHGTVRFSADCTYGDATDGVSIMQLNYSKVGNAPISEARIVYNTAYTANYAYLEVKFAGAASDVSVNVELQDALGWSLIAPNTAGSIPDGYTSHTLTFIPSLKIIPGTFPKVTFNQEGRITAGAPLLASDVPLLNQDTTGNAGTTTKLQTSRAINGTQFDGTASITTEYWGKARTLTIGNSSKQVDGSGNVTWTLAEINATGNIYANSREFTSSSTWTAGPNTSQIVIEGCGGGGYGGPGAWADGSGGLYCGAGGGGGGGSEFLSRVLPVNPGATYTVTIGASGGASSFGSAITFTPGSNGGAGSGPYGGGAGGAGSGSGDAGGGGGGTNTWRNGGYGGTGGRGFGGAGGYGGGPGMGSGVTGPGNGYSGGTPSNYGAGGGGGGGGGYGDGDPESPGGAAAGGPGYIKIYWA